MNTSLDQWLQFLRESGAAVGFPLVVAGIALMIFGWRLWRICVMVSFALIGGYVAARLSASSPDQWMYSIAGGATLGLLSYWPKHHSVALLGGSIVAALVAFSLESMSLAEPLFWSISGVALIGGVAFAYLNRQRVVILVTAFLGAMLLMSGLATWLMAMPALYGTLRSLASSSAIVLPFLLLVPTVMSGFYQIAEVRRLHAEL